MRWRFHCWNKMPDTLDTIRAAREADLAAVLRKLNARHRPRVMAAIREFGSVQAIPVSFWHELEREADLEVGALMILLLSFAYADTQRSIGIQPPNEARLRQGTAGAAAVLSTTTSRDYAESVRSSLISRIDRQAAEINSLSTTQAVERIRDEVARAMPARKLRPEGRDAADSVAITNTTAGISTGQRAGARDSQLALQTRGAGGDGATTATISRTRVALVWRTERDARVCPKCSPLNGQPDAVWSAKYIAGPPAHPNCRCQLQAVITTEQAQA